MSAIGDIAANFGEQVLYELPLQYHAEYVDRILSVTGEAVARVARR